MPAGDRLDALLDQRHRLLAEGAHRAAQHGLLRDDVVGVAGMHLGDRDHRRIERRHVARHHALQGRDDLGGDDHRIDAALRPRAVCALAGDMDIEQAAARHLRAGADGELADIELGPVVHAEDLLAGELLEQPVLDHRLGAAAALLRRLEDEMDGAVEIARRGKVLGGAEQHGGVAVMAAGMHAALVAGCDGRRCCARPSAARPCRRAARWRADCCRPGWCRRRRSCRCRS